MSKLIDDLEPVAYQLEYDEFSSVDVRLELRRGYNGITRWAIAEGRACLNKSGAWEFEPLPSGRDDAYYARCRWDTALEALAFWRQGDYRSRFRRGVGGQ